MLAAYEFVDYVVLFGEDTPYEIIQALRPDVLVKGGDYHSDEVAGRDIVESDNGTVEIIPLIDGRSTSRILEKAKQAESGNHRGSCI